LPSDIGNSGRVEKIAKHAIKWAMALSLLLHVLAFIILGFGLDFLKLLRPAVAQPLPDNQPIVFTFAETPQSARIEKPNPDARYASDKNAQAQNPEAPRDLPLGEPFAHGAFAEADLPPQQKSSSGSQPAGDEQAESGSAEKSFGQSHEEARESWQAITLPNRTSSSASSFRRELLTGGVPASQESSPGRDNRDTRAPEFGNFSLNTYNWDFAPYLFWLKRRIQSNIYPPPAFTHMGLISGQTRLRFRIHRDGTLYGPELLEYNGHASLMQTSMRAVEVSVPFKKLPDDFPEEYLEVTAQFEYTILRGDRP
jgi:hypothetical protein